MKLVLLLLLIITVLSGCEKRNLSVSPQEEQTGEQQETAGPIDETNIEPLMGSWGSLVTEEGFYYVMNHHVSQNLMYTDFETMQQVYLCSSINCTHSDESCESLIKDGGYAFLAELQDGNLLVERFYTNATSGLSYETLEVMDKTGRFVRELYSNKKESGSGGNLQVKGISDKAVYCIENPSSNFTRYFSVDLETGRIFLFLEDGYSRPGSNLSLQFAGKKSYVIGDSFYLADLQPDPENFDPSAESYDALPSENLVSLWKTEVSNGIPQLVYSELVPAQGNFANAYIGDYYVMNLSHTAYRAVNLTTGATKEITLPDVSEQQLIILSETELIEGYFSVIIVDSNGDEQSLHVNLESGEAIPVSLTHTSGSELEGQGQKTLSILFDLGDDLVVGVGEQEFFYDYETQEGIAMIGQPVTDYALISEADYLANNPNYRTFDNSTITTALNSQQ